MRIQKKVKVMDDMEVNEYWYLKEIGKEKKIEKKEYEEEMEMNNHPETTEMKKEEEK